MGFGERVVYQLRGPEGAGPVTHPSAEQDCGSPHLPHAAYTGKERLNIRDHSNAEKGPQTQEEWPLLTWAAAT